MSIQFDPREMTSAQSASMASQGMQRLNQNMREDYQNKINTAGAFIDSLLKEGYHISTIGRMHPEIMETFSHANPALKRYVNADMRESFNMMNDSERAKEAMLHTQLNQAPAVGTPAVGAGPEQPTLAPPVQAAPPQQPSIAPMGQLPQSNIQETSLLPPQESRVIPGQGLTPTPSRSMDPTLHPPGERLDGSPGVSRPELSVDTLRERNASEQFRRPTNILDFAKREEELTRTYQKLALQRGAKFKETTFNPDEFAKKLKDADGNFDALSAEDQQTFAYHIDRQQLELEREKAKEMVASRKASGSFNLPSPEEVESTRNEIRQALLQETTDQVSAAYEKLKPPVEQRPGVSSPTRQGARSTSNEEIKVLHDRARSTELPPKDRAEAVTDYIWGVRADSPYINDAKAREAILTAITQYEKQADRNMELMNSPTFNKRIQAKRALTEDAAQQLSGLMFAETQAQNSINNQRNKQMLELETRKQGLSEDRFSFEVAAFLMQSQATGLAQDPEQALKILNSNDKLIDQVMKRLTDDGHNRLSNEQAQVYAGILDNTIKASMTLNTALIESYGTPEHGDEILSSGATDATRTLKSSPVEQRPGWFFGNPEVIDAGQAAAVDAREAATRAGEVLRNPQANMSPAGKRLLEMIQVQSQ